MKRFLLNTDYLKVASSLNAPINASSSNLPSRFRISNPCFRPAVRAFAGHNKWSKIRHKKGSNDKKKAALMGKASRAITVAAKDCGGDMSDLRLQSAISHAKSVQLTKDRIEEAISKATAKSSSDQQDFSSLRFDAMMNFGSSNIGCVITALSDNRNRTTQQVRHLVSKHGGEFLPTDTLAYIFEHVGWVVVSDVADEEALFEAALEAGATNIEEDDADEEIEDSTNTFVVTTEEKDLFQVVAGLREAGYNIAHFEHRYILQDQEHGGVEVSPEGEEALIDFLEKMDETDDVNNVYHNAV
eukprot:scaffold2331_cov126-Cylindrotheca_fusiformis.AAC.5